MERNKVVVNEQVNDTILEEARKNLARLQSMTHQEVTACLLCARYDISWEDGVKFAKMIEEFKDEQ
jgi:hypothetical protein